MSTSSPGLDSGACGLGLDSLLREGIDLTTVLPMLERLAQEGSVEMLAQDNTSLTIRLKLRTSYTK